MNKQKNGLNYNTRPGHKTHQKSINNGCLEYNWRTLFMARSGGWSSKRFLGVLGFITSLTLLISAFIMDKEVPKFADMVLIASSSLVGVDAFRGIFTKNFGE